jgi:hypothetical protein
MMQYEVTTDSAARHRKVLVSLRPLIDPVRDGIDLVDGKRECGERHPRQPVPQRGIGSNAPNEPGVRRIAGRYT